MMRGLLISVYPMINKRFRDEMAIDKPHFVIRKLGTIIIPQVRQGQIWHGE